MFDVFVVERDVIKDVLLLRAHAVEAVTHYHGHFVGESRIVGQDAGDGAREDMAVAVLMLQALPVKGGASGSGPERETAAARIRKRPKQVASALEPEHGVKNVEGDRDLAMCSIAEARCREARDAA